MLTQIISVEWLSGSIPFLDINFYSIKHIYYLGGKEGKWERKKEKEKEEQKNLQLLTELSVNSSC